jgi:lysophospholipase
MFHDPTVAVSGDSLVTPLSMFGLHIVYDIVEFSPLMDSACMSMSDWAKIAHEIKAQYSAYDSFVVLHGTDTLAYTASALSFMLEHLGKTVVITGAQIPITEHLNDAHHNLLGALTVCGHFIIPEVTGRLTQFCLAKLTYT